MQKRDKEIQQTISLEQARKDLQKIVGLPVSRAWKGYGTAIFLELGELHKNYRGWENKDGENFSMQGDWTLGSDGNWQIIQEESVTFDATKFDKIGTSTKPVKEAIEQFVAKTITSVVLNDDVTALSLAFNNGVVLKMNKADYGFYNLFYNFPTVLGFDEDGSIYYEHNKL
jgi:hypothetical protein